MAAKAAPRHAGAVPVSHGDLLQHGRAGVRLPVPRNGRPPAKEIKKITHGSFSDSREQPSPPDQR